MSTMFKKKIVDRLEYKYFIPTNKVDELINILSKIMILDKNCLHNNFYKVTSLYLDDFYNKDYNEKLDGIQNRVKYRIRFYDDDLSSSKFEIKKKNGLFSQKISFKIKKYEIDMIKKNNYFFLKSLKDFPSLPPKFLTNFYEPKTIVQYKRIAFSYPTNDIRLTIDKDLRSFGFFNDITNLSSKKGIRICPPGLDVIEIKYSNEFPFFLRNILKDFPSIRSAISKYTSSRIVNNTELKSDDPIFHY